MKVAGTWTYLYRAVNQYARSSTSCYRQGATWQPASGLHCAHLSLSTYDWKNVSDPAANCP